MTLKAQNFEDVEPIIAGFIWSKAVEFLEHAYNCRALHGLACEP